MWEHLPSEILHFTNEYEASDDALAIPQRSTEERPRMKNV